MQHAFNFDPELLQVINIIEKLEEMGLLHASRTFNLMDNPVPLEKIDFYSAYADLLKFSPITMLMEKPTQQHKIRLSLQIQITREKPKLPPTNKKIINLNTSKNQTPKK